MLKSLTQPTQEIVYNAIGAQDVIDISPNKLGALQVQCSPDAKYSLLGSIDPKFDPQPIPEMQNMTGPAIFGSFATSETLQLNIVNLGTSGTIKVQLKIY